MINSAILEVIIGLIFVYSLLAILVTQINTVIGNLFNLRARHLKNALIDLITDPTTQTRFLTHPLISLVRQHVDPSRPVSAEDAARVAQSGATEVSWIEPVIFADVLLDLVSEQVNSERNVYAPLLRVANTVLDNEEKTRMRALVRDLQTTGRGLDDVRAAILSLTDLADRQAMLQALDEVETALQQYPTNAADLIAIYQGLQNVEDDSFRRALETVLGPVRDIAEARLKIQRWFDGSMDQATRTYRRLIQYISLIIGLALAVVLNVDSLQLARSLWDDPALRETVVVAARNSLESGELEQTVRELPTPMPEDIAVVELTPEPTEPDTGVVTTPEPDTGDDSADDVERELTESVEQTQTTIENLLDLRLPIGWTYAPVAPDAVNPLDPNPLDDTRNLWNFSPLNNPANWLSLWLRKFVGLVITMIAVSQGAPFWFDLLNRIARGKEQ